MEGKDSELDLESCELVGGHITRETEIKGLKIGVMCERIELTTQVIKFRKQ